MGKRQYKHRGYNESGQSLILIAFSIFALLGFVGLAIDLGLSYVDRVRARRAADAAALGPPVSCPWKPPRMCVLWNTSKQTGTLAV